MLVLRVYFTYTRLFRRDKDISGLAAILRGLSTDKYDVINQQVQLLATYSPATKADYFASLVRDWESRLKNSVDNVYQRSVAQVAHSRNSDCSVMYLCVGRRLDPHGVLSDILRQQQRVPEWFRYVAPFDGMTSLIFYDIYRGADIAELADIESFNLRHYLTTRHERSLIVKSRPRDDYLIERGGGGADANSVTDHVRRALLEQQTDDRRLNDARIVVCVGPLHRQAVNPAPFISLCAQAMIDTFMAASRGVMYVLFDLAAIEPRDLINIVTAIQRKVPQVKAIFGRDPRVHHVTAVMLHLSMSTDAD